MLFYFSRITRASRRYHSHKVSTSLTLFSGSSSSFFTFLFLFSPFFSLETSFFYAMSLGADWLLSVT